MKVLKMNKRIKQLAEQARKHFPATEHSGEFWVFDEAKFAELIVRECADICQQAIEQNNQTRARLTEDELAEKMVIHGSIRQAEKLAQGIKQHFGVEE